MTIRPTFSRAAQSQARTRRRIPSKTRRRAASPKPGEAAERLAVRANQRVARVAWRIINQELLELIESDARYRTDAQDSRTLEAIFSARLDEEFPKGWYMDMDASDRAMDRRSKEDFAQMGIVPDAPVLEAYESGKLAAEARVKALYKRQVGRLAAVLDPTTEGRREALTAALSAAQGRPARVIRDEILKQVFKSDKQFRGYAELLARDQVLTTHAEMTRMRMQGAGIGSYVWTTSKDERVREMHADLEGGQFDWNNPPVTNEQGDTNHPGEDYQCRCTAYPIIDDFK